MNIGGPSSLDSGIMNNYNGHGAAPQPPQPQIQTQGLPDPAYTLTEVETIACTQNPDRILPRIHTLPRARPLEFASEPPPGKLVTFDTQINQNAALTYSRGREILGDDVCNKCAAGKGIFQKCVVLEEFNKGSCANCVIHSYGHRCSFRASRMYIFRCLTSQGWAFRKLTPFDL